MLKTIWLFTILFTTWALFPPTVCGEETSPTGIVNRFIQHELDSNINTENSALTLSLEEDYSNFSFNYYRKFGYSFSSSFLAFSDVTFTGNRYNAYLAHANVGLEYTKKDHKTAVYTRVYEKDIPSSKFYFSFGLRFN